MLDVAAQVIGYCVIAAIAITIALATLVILHRVLIATVDVLSQYLLIWIEKRPVADGVTFWQAWTSSLDCARWSYIVYRIRRMVTGDRTPYDVS